MTEMIEAEPYVADRIVERVGGADGPAARLAAAIGATVRERRPIVVTGCGTSEHGALGVAEQVAEALRETGAAAHLVRAEQAFEYALEPIAGGLVIGVSHEGGTAATNEALEGARRAGARTALITAAADSPAAGLADPELVVATRELDQSWCHTVGYLSPLVVGACVAAAIRGAEPGSLEIHRLLATPLRHASAFEALAEALGSVDRLVVVGSGADRVTARELVLKVEEGSGLAAAYRDVETLLHGHLGGVDDRTGLVAIVLDRRAATDRARRTRQLLAAARELAMPTAAVLSSDAAAGIDPVLTPAGRFVVADERSLPSSSAALFGGLVPLQLLTERLARNRGRNPDPIRRDDPRYLAAAEAAEGG
jgi:fructoselysine-6-P-deglycase FrlB-like protein